MSGNYKYNCVTIHYNKRMAEGLKDVDLKYIHDGHWSESYRFLDEKSYLVMKFMVSLPMIQLKETIVLHFYPLV